VNQDQLPGSFFGPPSLVALLKHRALHQPDEITYTFLVDGESQEVCFTNAELDRKARAIAAWLESHDLVGQRALLLYPPGLDFVAAFFGCLYAGVVAVTAYPPRANRSLERIRSIVRDCDAKAALTTQDVWQRVQPLLAETTDLQQLDWLHSDEIPDSLADEWRDLSVGPDTLAFLQYTSGSTGTPKGVMMTHGNLLHNSALIAHAFEHTRSSTGVFWLPSYHDMGLVGGILQPLYVGRPNVLMSPMSFLQKPCRWLHAITRYGGTTSGGPNFAYQLCVDKITPQQCEGLDLSTWKVAFNGAEPIRPETLERFIEKFAPFGFRPQAFYPCYGLAEASLIVTGGYMKERPKLGQYDTTALERHRAVPVESDTPGARRLVGCGECLPDGELLIVDPDLRRPLQERQVGEIWFRGPSVARGYWQRDAETAETFGAQLADNSEAAYLRTGDLGFIDHGELFVTGRIKDLIILRGVNHYPQDIEFSAETAHPALRSGCSAAFTVEDDRGNLRLVIVQEIERGQHDQADDAIDAICRDVAHDHELRVDAVVLLKAGRIPKTSSGKIQRRACRQAYLAEELVSVAHWESTQIADGPVETADTAEPAPSSQPKVRGERTTVREKSNAASDVLRADNGHAAHDGNGHSTQPAESHRITLDEAYQAVTEAIRAMAPERATHLTPTTSLADVGFDSLQRIELQTKLEDRLGGRIPEQRAIELETLEEIAAAVLEYLGQSTNVSERTLDDIPAEDYDIAQFSEYQKLRQQADMLEAAGLENPFFVEHESVAGGTTMIDGRKMINFSNYNYLGMSGDPDVSRAAKKAIDRHGTSVSASRLVSGQNRLHTELEHALADLVGAEAAITFVGGHATNESTIGHLVGPNDLILHDALAHNSIVQGAILSGASRRTFPHNDAKALERILSEVRTKFRRVLIAIESVYSMDGDVAPLPEFVDVKKRCKCLLFVDEAHSIGILGKHGRGIGEAFDVHPRDVDLWMGTLSKALGSCGGYIAGRQELIEYLRYTAPGFVFSCGMTAASAAAALASIRVLESQPQRVARLQRNADLFLRLAREHGLNTGLSQGTPIVPVILGSSLKALQLSQALGERGINVKPIMYPAVEESKARLRFFLSSLHTEEQLRYTVQAVAEELNQLNGLTATSPAAGAPSTGAALSAGS